MKAILFDPFSGASGNMIIASLVDLGANALTVKKAMETAAEVDVEMLKTSRKGISACLVEVSTRKKESLSYHAVVERVNSINLPSHVISDALDILNILGNAEAKLHGVALEELSLHELGQEDAIADIVGACMAFHDLGLKKYRIYTMPINVGMGFVDSSHGKLPVPAPATLEILREYSLPWQYGYTHAELLTPTGAAILAHFVNEVGMCQPMKAHKIGYGAGHAELPLPNVLRTISGEIDDALISDGIEMLETNVDDVIPQVLGNLIDELLASGARDVAIIPATMKKGRSGHIIQVITKPQDSERLARKIIQETGTLGVRIIPVKHRLIVKRDIDKVRVVIDKKEYYIAIKIARDLRGKLLNISAEFEDCRRVAHESGVPVREVMQKAENEARRVFSS